MKVALITGITGQDGSYLAEILLEKNYDVWGIIRRSSNFTTSRIEHLYNNESLFLKYGDLSDGSNILSILNEIKDKYKEMQSAIARGMKYSAKEYLDAVDFMKRSYESYKEVFEDYHGVLSPCSTGVADKGLKSTGSADFNRVWSYLHTPAISLPLLQGENNLPLGIQLIGDKYDDHRFLGVARWLEQKSKKYDE